MKRKFIRCGLFSLALLCGLLKAQSFAKKQMDLNLGFGIGNTIIGSGSSRVFLPLSASLDIGITDDISIGAYLGYTGATYNYYGWEKCKYYTGSGTSYYFTDSYRWNYLVLGLRGAYHFGRFVQIDKLDVYAGLMIGNDFAHSAYSTNSVCPDHIRYSSGTYGGAVLSIYAGARYRFTDNFGVYSELGYGISFLSIGANFKF